ncbi:hypothetical protein JVU11DRAFT_7761 [Chiua virens]|nr:hypothetical protein JVU11DRAFT_7761 [Chiua virens]
MTLESLPDRFDPTIHQELDRAVNDEVSDVIDDIEYLSLSDCFYLLNTIIRHSEGDLNSSYIGGGADAKRLMKTELKSMLVSAWQQKSYREIRNLAILKAPKPQATTARSDIPEDLRVLSGSFAATYRGAAVDGFYEYLTQNEKLFRTTEGPKYYAKFCSIVQSSGAGKSRMLTELGKKKDVIVLYMNLRGKEETSGFPTRDPIPAAILTTFPSEKAYRIICYAFFVALFDTVEETLSGHTTSNVKEAVMEWSRKMCDMIHPPRTTARSDFFGKLSMKYERVYADLVVQAEQRHDETAQESTMPNIDNETPNADLDETTDKFGNLAISVDSKTKHFDFTTRLLVAYSKMVSTLDRIFPNCDSSQPMLVIAVDEAHPLTRTLDIETEGKYRPADVFCRVVNEYSHSEYSHPGLGRVRFNDLQGR